MTLCAVEAASWGAEREVPELSRDCVAALLRWCGCWGREWAVMSSKPVELLLVLA